MPPAAKHFDPILGVDIHMIQPPAPGPPVPIPHPHTGMILDPIDYAPWIGGTVKVGGLQRAQAGTASMSIPKHIPIGGVFVKPPADEGEMFMGSSTVSADGDAFSYLALPLLTCHDVGMVAPGRPKGSPPKSLVLPTTVVLSVPMPVMVGGGPTVSLMSLGMMAGMKLLGKGFSKFVKNSKKWKKFAGAIQDYAKKAMKKVGIPPSMRKKVADAICSVTGHPVDVASGMLLTDRVDIEIKGPLPFRFERKWYSSSTNQGPLGHGWHHSYDFGLHLSERVVLFRNSEGRHIGFPRPAVGDSSYNRQDRLTLGRDERGYWVRDFDLKVYRFGRAERRPADELVLTSIENRAGKTLSFIYDARGSLSKVVQGPGGRTFEFHCDDRGRILGIDGPHPTEKHARVTLAKYRYNDEGDLVEVLDALSNRQRFQYSDHLLVRETDRNGLSFYFEWEGASPDARCIRTWGDGGIYDHKLNYRDDLSATVVENSLGNKVTYHHDGAVVHKVVDAYGNESTTEYDDDYKVIKEVNELGATTEYEYDDHGNCTTVTTAERATAQAEFDDRDLRTKLIDLKGNEWRWTYDERGRMTERHDPEGGVVTFEYRGAWLVGIRDPAGSYTALNYDMFGNVTRVQRPLMGTIEREFDYLSRRTLIRDAAGNTETQEFDLLGRTLVAREPDGNTREMEWDAEGNQTRFKDLNHDVTMTYAGMGVMTSWSESGGTARFEYDTEENITAIRNELGYVYRFGYDAVGEMSEQEDFGGRKRRITRDGAGNITRVDWGSGRFREHQFDQMDRQIKVTYWDGAVENYAYWPDGQMKLAQNPTCAVKFERNAFGQTIKETTGQDWVASEYDGRGKRVRISSSFGADQVITRNAVGDCVDLSDRGFSAQFDRDVLGRELLRTLPGGIRARWERDRFGRPLKHEIMRGEFLDRSLSYAWAAEHRLRSTTDARGRKSEYEHNQKGELVAVRHRDGTVQLRLPDAFGNIFKSRQQDDRGYGPDGEVLWSRGPDGVTEYEYDEDRNLVCKKLPSGKQWRYHWDAAGGLRRVTRPDGDEVMFEYDALRRRVSKTFRGKKTRWLWDGDVPLHEWCEAEPGATSDAPPRPEDAASDQRDAELAEIHPRGPPLEGTKDAPITWVFDPGTFSPIGATLGEEVYSFISDQAGAPVAVYDGSGQRLWSAEIDAWGELREQEGSIWQPFRWPGQYADAETGLYYNRFRYYDPDVGEYISEDPTSLLGGFNTHRYVDDPLRFCDPFGLYNGKGERDLGVYDTWDDYTMHEDDWKQSRPHHNRVCNESLYDYMNKNDAYKKNMEKQFPGIYEKVSPGPGGGFHDGPPHKDLTWHHHDDPGRMQLVNRADHRKYHRIYHPDGTGGYKKWGKGCG